MNNPEFHQSSHVKAPISDEVRGDLMDALRRVGVSGDRLLLDGFPVARLGVDWSALPLAVPELASALYSHWFAAWAPPVDAHRFPAGNGAFFASIRAAHAGAARYEAGWMAIGAVSSHTLLAARGAETRLVAFGDYINLRRPGTVAMEGDALAVILRRDAPLPQDGWWVTWGAAGPAPDEGMLRLYWNCGPSAVAALVHGITSAAEDARVRYTLKCPSSPSLFGRKDGVVFYLATEDWPRVAPALCQVHRRLADWLGEGTPPMTFRLGRGAGLAEDPANGHSFGQTMSWAVATGILASIALDPEDIEARLAMMAECLQAAGISPTRPYARSIPLEEEIQPW